VALVPAELAHRLVSGLARHPCLRDELLQLGAHRFRIAAELLGFLEEEALEQLDLRAHGDVLADRHREGAGREAREAGQPDEARSRLGRADSQDQRHVRDQPVAHAEDGGPGRAALHVGGALPGGVARDCLFGHRALVPERRRDRKIENYSRIQAAPRRPMRTELW
jgi:hypothetical protein